MSKKKTALLSLDGTARDSHIGLVDKQGMFLLLLDTNEVVHYRFSNADTAIRAIGNDLANYKQTCKQLEKDLKNSEKHRKCLAEKHKNKVKQDERKYTALEERYKALSEAVAEMLRSVPKQRRDQYRRRLLMLGVDLDD